MSQCNLLISGNRVTNQIYFTKRAYMLIFQIFPGRVKAVISRPVITGASRSAPNDFNVTKAAVLLVQQSIQPNP